MRMVSFRGHPELHIYSRYVYIKLWLDHYNMRYQDLKRKSVD